MGSQNYWRRRICLEKFDAWYYDGQRSEWRERWRKNQQSKITSPEEFFEALLALTNFVLSQREKDPNYRPPRQFMEIVARVRPILHEIIATAS
jgi:hypothetical protein